MSAQIDVRKPFKFHDRELATWAVDRTLEYLKVNSISEDLYTQIVEHVMRGEAVLHAAHLVFTLSPEYRLRCQCAACGAKA